MSRPESIEDIPLEDRIDLFATFYLDKISSNSDLLFEYTRLLSAVENVGGIVKRSDYSLENVSFYVYRDKQQLDYELSRKQANWDSLKEQYEKAVLRDGIDDLREWQRDSIRKWAETEGLPDPFDPFATNNEDLQKIRADLGMNE